MRIRQWSVDVKAISTCAPPLTNAVSCRTAFHRSIAIDRAPVRPSVRPSGHGAACVRVACVCAPPLESWRPPAMLEGVQIAVRRRNAACRKSELPIISSYNRRTQVYFGIV